MNKDIYLIGEAYKNQILEASKGKQGSGKPKPKTTPTSKKPPTNSKAAAAAAFHQSMSKEWEGPSEEEKEFDDLHSGPSRPIKNAPPGKFQVGDAVRIEDYGIEGTVVSYNNKKNAYPMVQIKITKSPQGQFVSYPIGSIIFYPANNVEKISPLNVTRKKGSGRAKPNNDDDIYDDAWHRKVEQGDSDEAEFDAKHPGGFGYGPPTSGY